MVAGCSDFIGYRFMVSVRMWLTEEDSLSIFNLIVGFIHPRQKVEGRDFCPHFKRSQRRVDASDRAQPCAETSIIIGEIVWAGSQPHHSSTHSMPCALLKHHPP